MTGGRNFVNNCYTAQDLRNSCTIKSCSVFFFYFSSFTLVCVVFFTMKHRFGFFILLFYLAWSLVLDFKLKIKSNWKYKIISTPVPLENLLFNHFHSRLNITVIFPGYIRVSSYPVFLLISHSRASNDEPNKKNLWLLSEHWIQLIKTDAMVWILRTVIENVMQYKMWTVVKDVLDVSTIITKVFFFFVQ